MIEPTEHRWLKEKSLLHPHWHSQNFDGKNSIANCVSDYLKSYKIHNVEKVNEIKIMIEKMNQDYYSANWLRYKLNQSINNNTSEEYYQLSNEIDKLIKRISSDLNYLENKLRDIEINESTLKTLKQGEISIRLDEKSNDLAEITIELEKITNKLTEKQNTIASSSFWIQLLGTAVLMAIAVLPIWIDFIRN